MAITKATASSIAPAAKGDLVAGNATNDAGVLAVGANGTVLTADSSEATGLKWAAPAGGGGFTSLASGSLPSATSLDLTTISGDYKDLRLVFRNLQQSSTNEITARLNGSGSAIYNGFSLIAENTTATTQATAAQTKFYGTYNYMESSTTAVLQIDIFDYANSTSHKNLQVRSQFTRANTSGIEGIASFWTWRNTAAVNQITVFAPGTFSAGTYELFGIK